MILIFYHLAIKGSSQAGPHVIIDTQMTVEHEFKILTSARWRFAFRSIQFSLVY